MIPYIIILALGFLSAVLWSKNRQLRNELLSTNSVDNTPEVKPEDLVPPLPEEAEVISAKNENTDSPKILVIEDHKDIQLFLKVIFKNEYILYMAENGEEGLKLAQEVVPDLVITDIMMPIMDGFECTRLLKEDLTTCHIPIIQLTALCDIDNTIKGMELGADDYITKPFKPEILKAKVKQLIKNRQELKQFYTRLLLPPTEETEASKESIWDELKQKDPFAAKLFSLLEENCTNKQFSIVQLAEELNVSQATLYRKVKRTTHFTINELIRTLRMQKASLMLKEQNYNIQQIAEKVGYTDSATFRKHFVEYYGTTPSRFLNEQ